MWRHRAQQSSTPVKREAAVAGLASEGLALVAGSAGAGSSAVVLSTPTNPVRGLKALSAAKEHTNEERGGGHDPGVRKPGASRGQLPARSKIFRLLFLNVFFFLVFVCARSLIKPFFHLSQPGSCAWLSPFLLCADCTCVLVCVCLCMCM